MSHSRICLVFAAPLHEATCMSPGWARRRLFALCLLTFTVLISVTEADPDLKADESPRWHVNPDGCFLVDDFDDVIQNRPGG
ncbi:MAG: hypothetical protein H8E37_02290 [Planctomycetes bacterium]|nr:hypothetical protein [Planctomycetota bacterium]